MKIAAEKGIRIGVAVSGGADSMALLDCYLKAGADVTVINVEHGLRGNASVADSEFVKNYCAGHNVVCLAFRVDAKTEAKNSRISAELAARKLRYEIFDRLLSEGQVDKIALAHHADDNMETVLMRIFRGTGIKGLAGICDRDGYIHPFLEFTKQEILDYVAQNGIPYVVDETNLQNDVSRNYIRNKIVPLIKKKFGGADAAVARLCKSAAEVEEYLSAKTLAYTEERGKYYLNGIFAAHPLIQKYSVQNVLNAMGGVQDIESRHLNYVLELSDKPFNTYVNLPFNIIAARGAKGLIFGYQDDYTAYSADFFVHKKYSYGGSRYSFVKGGAIKAGATLDLDKLPKGSVVRTRRDGDIFKRVNGRTKLVSDYLNGLKMDVFDKRKLLVLAKGKEVFAILGVETGDKVKIDEKTANIIHIVKEIINK